MDLMIIKYIQIYVNIVLIKKDLIRRIYKKITLSFLKSQNKYDIVFMLKKV